MRAQARRRAVMLARCNKLLGIAISFARGSYPLY